MLCSIQASGESDLLDACADSMLYKLIKREMDCGHGIVSQVLIAGKASGLGHQGRGIGRNQLQQYIMNVSLKVNHKLGGQNMRIHGFGELSGDRPAMWSKKPTMLLGIDVTHPQSFDTQEPSIVGIVASMDRHAAPSSTIDVTFIVLMTFCTVVSCVFECSQRTLTPQDTVMFTSLTSMLMP
jgi:hypothetical protein